MKGLFFTWRNLSLGCGFLLLAMGMGGGCSLPSRHDHDGYYSDHGHDHDQETESVTIWTDALELFVEFPFLVVGEAHPFLLHLTHVDSGLALKDAEVGYDIEQRDSDGIITGTATYVRPGIYTMAPVFPARGDWTLHIRVALATGVEEITVPELDVHGADEDHEHSSHASVANAIPLTKEQQWMAPVVTEATRLEPMVERHKLPAMATPTSENRQVVLAPVNGTLQSFEDDLFPRVGDVVVAGQPLVWVAPHALSAEALAHGANLQGAFALHEELASRSIVASGEAARTRALVTQYENELRRAEQLLDARAGSQRDVDTLRGALNEARAALAAAEQSAAHARRAAEAITDNTARPETRPVYMDAPVSGRITRVFTGADAYVEGGASVFEIVNSARVLIEARAHESQLPTLASPPSGYIELPGRPGELMAVVAPENAPSPWIQPYVDPETRTAPVLLYATNPNNLLYVGMSLTFWADGRSIAEALTIPLSAVVDENGIPTVYVMIEGELFERRPVRLGIGNGQRVQALEGLAFGERVVARGAYVVRLAGLDDAGLGSAHVH